MIIKTNNKPREIVSFFELKKKHQKEMVEVFGERAEELEFFTYKNNVYCLNDFCVVDRHSQIRKHWDASYSDTTFSAVLIRFTNCGDFVIVGMLYS